MFLLFVLQIVMITLLFCLFGRLREVGSGRDTALSTLMSARLHLTFTFGALGPCHFDLLFVLGASIFVKKQFLLNFLVRFDFRLHYGHIVFVVELFSRDWVPLLDIVELLSSESTLDRDLSRRVRLSDESFVQGVSI